MVAVTDVRTTDQDEFECRTFRSTVSEFRRMVVWLTESGVPGLIDSVTRLVCAAVMVVSILYQGGMARYFLKRRNDVALYLSSPDWARSLALSMPRHTD